MIETAASAKLRSIDHLFERQYLQLTDRVHVAVGYGVSISATGRNYLHTSTQALREAVESTD